MLDNIITNNKVYLAYSNYGYNDMCIIGIASSLDNALNMTKHLKDKLVIDEFELNNPGFKEKCVYKNGVKNAIS